MYVLCMYICVTFRPRLWSINQPKLQKRDALGGKVDIRVPSRSWYLVEGSVFLVAPSQADIDACWKYRTSRRS
jgi:hypothetical protein